MEHASYLAEETWIGIRLHHRCSVSACKFEYQRANKCSVCAVAIIRQVILYRNNASGAQETDGTRTEIPLYIWLWVFTVPTPNDDL